MKLSEAIRLNGMTKPQGYGVESMGSCDAPCALGGALQAVGKQNTRNFEGKIDGNFHTVTILWPWTYEKIHLCPACGERERALNTIWHLNDAHRWTRQQIADWVATVEPEEMEKWTVEVVSETVVA